MFHNIDLTVRYGTVTHAQLSMVTDEIESASRPRKKYNKNIPDKIKVKIGAILHGTKAALEHFSNLHSKFKFVRTSAYKWKLGTLKKRKIDCKMGRPNLLSQDMLRKVKDIVIGTRADGGVISRRMVI